MGADHILREVVMIYTYDTLLLHGRRVPYNHQRSLYPSIYLTTGMVICRPDHERSHRNNLTAKFNTGKTQKLNSLNYKHRHARKVGPGRLLRRTNAAVLISL